MEHSNALHSRIKARGAYLTGPMARFALNFDRLSPIAQQAARDANVGPDCRNPFRSIIIRAVELLYACDEAIRIIDSYKRPDKPAVNVIPRQATGCACTEAPRGILYHRYRIDDHGLIQEAKIVPPTSQNQKTMEADLESVVTPRISMPVPELTALCEQAIRNYDPCISCATHFLKIQVERE